MRKIICIDLLLMTLNLIIGCEQIEDTSTVDIKTKMTNETVKTDEKIEVQPVQGLWFNGDTFIPDQVKLENDHIIFRTGVDFFPDKEIDIWVHTINEQSCEKLSSNNASVNIKEMISGANFPEIL